MAGGPHRDSGSVQVITVEADQGHHGVGQVHAVVFLAELPGQFQARLQLGQGVIPLAGDEALEPEHYPEAGQRPAFAAFLADPPARVESGPGFLEPVELDQDVPAGSLHGILAPAPGQAVLGQPQRLVGGAQRVGELAAGCTDHGQRGLSDAGRKRVVGGRRGGGCPPGRAGRAVQVSRRKPGKSSKSPRIGVLDLGEQG
jgi:hypothetical protein